MEENYANASAQPAARGAEEERLLIERAQRGDTAAFEALLKRHQRRVLSLVHHLLRRPNEVEDIAQQIFLKVYLALPRFDFRSAFSTWLYRITVNECYDYLRRQRAQKSPASAQVPLEDVLQAEPMAESATRPAHTDFAAQAERRQIVEKLLQRLSPEDRLMLTLKELEGFSVEEISRVTKLRENTVKVRLFRARRRLAEAYRRFAGRRAG